MHYPVNLVLTQKRCLVVGGGKVAAHKVKSLVQCGANVHVIAPEIKDEIREMPVTLEERPYRHGDVEGFRLVITATDKRAVNAQVFEDCEEAGVWVNAADEPESCTFTLPALVRHGDLLLTVSTGGRSPALAGWLKERLGADLAHYDTVIDLLEEARAAIKAKGLSTQNFEWKSLLDGDLIAAVKKGELDEAKVLVTKFVNDSLR